MNVKRAYTGIGDETSEGYLTIRIYSENKSSFKVYDTKNQEETEITVDDSSAQIQIKLTGKKQKHILSIHLEEKPKQVKLDNDLHIQLPVHTLHALL